MHNKKYNCEICKFSSDSKKSYETHTNSNKHKTLNHNKKIHNNLINIISEAEKYKLNLKKLDNIEINLHNQTNLLDKYGIKNKNKEKEKACKHDNKIIEINQDNKIVEIFDDFCPLCKSECYSNDFINKFVDINDIKGYVKIKDKKVPLNKLREHSEKCMHHKVHKLITHMNKNNLIMELINKLEMMNMNFNLLNSKLESLNSKCNSAELYDSNIFNNVEIKEKELEQQYKKLSNKNKDIYKTSKIEIENLTKLKDIEIQALKSLHNKRIEYLEDVIEKQRKELKKINHNNFNGDNSNNSNNNIYNYIIIQYNNPYILTQEMKTKISQSYLDKHMTSPQLSNKDHVDHVTRFTVDVDENCNVGELKEQCSIEDDGILGNCIANYCKNVLLGIGIDPDNLSVDINNIN